MVSHFCAPFPWLPGDGHLQNPHRFDDDLPRRVHAYAHLDGNAISPSARLLDGRGAGDHEAGISVEDLIPKDIEKMGNISRSCWRYSLYEYTRASKDLCYD